MAVELPAGEDLNEWLAVNTIEFYNEINVLYGILTEFCTAESCPTMSAGPKYEYLWADGHNVKTPLKVSAGEYIDFLMTWVENQLNNEKIFPCALGVPFPRNFETIIKVIFKRLFRVYAHIYHTHFQHIMLLSAETHEDVRQVIEREAVSDGDISEEETEETEAPRVRKQSKAFRAVKIWN